jgi:hypothetical protein
MKKILNNPWVVGALALAAVAFVANSLIPAGGGGSGVLPAEDAGAYEDTTETVVADGASDSGSIRDAMKELPQGSTARDPFASRKKAVAVAAATEEKVTAPDIVETVRLTALWTQDGETFALINNRVCRSGEALGGLTLESATQDGVWLTHWKGRDFVAIGASFTLTTPALKAAALSLSQESQPHGSL